MQQTAHRNLGVLKVNPRNPSLRFGSVGHYRSAQGSDSYMAVADLDGDYFIWFWMGNYEG